MGIIWRHHCSSLTVLIVCLLTSTAAPADSLPANDDTPQGAKAQAMMEVTGPDNAKMLQARWAIGSRENVEMLHIPLAYINPFSFVSCKSRLSRSDEGCKLGYVVDLILNIDLSSFLDMAIVSDEAQDYNSKAEIFLQSVLQGTHNFNPRQWRNIDVKTSIFMIPFGPGKNGKPVINKPEVFGLKVLGLEHGPKSDAVSTYEEVLYDGETPVMSDHVIVCAEAKLAGDDPASMRHYTPHCEQYIDIDEISAVAKIRYDRRNLGYWRMIDASVRTLLHSFTQKGH